MNTAVILAGGVGSRMRNDGFPKQYLEINGKPVLVYTLEKFQACDKVDHIIVVAHSQWEDQIRRWASLHNITKLTAIAPQGDTRQESVLSGLEASAKLSACENDIVLVHDAARPLVSVGMIEDCIDGIEGYDGCLPVIPLKDTVYHSIDGQSITNLTDRSTLFCGQSPESFRLLPYLALNKAATKQELQQIRGSSEIAFRGGFNIRMIPGEETNFKLTTSDDLVRLRSLLNHA